MSIAKVGKTTLIHSLVQEEFNEDLPDVYAQVTLPSFDDSRELVIRDTPSTPDRVAELEENVKEADVIVLVYSQDDEESYDRLASHWFPLFAAQGAENTPVILCANKMDLRGPEPMPPETCDPIFQPLMREFSQLETCLECSAKEQKNVPDIFFYAHKAVEYPVSPLFDMKNRCLTVGCRAALARIFHLCDFDNDGLLNDEELNGFQAKCFKSKLSPQELKSVKDVVGSKCPEGLQSLNPEDPNSNTALTQAGFLYLHRLFIEKSRQQTTWSVLRQFCYNDQLLLDPALVCGDVLKKEEPDQSTEMTSKARSFLLKLFKKADKDKDTLLSPSEMETFWQSVPEAMRPKDIGTSVTTSTSKVGAVTTEGFMAYWNLFYLRQPEDALLCLKYLGFQDDIAEAVTITPSRQDDFIRERTCRNVFQVYVFGSPGCGKTAFLRALVGKDYIEGFTPDLPFTTVQEMQPDEGDTTRRHPRYIAMTEFAVADTDAILADPKRMAACDLIVMLYASDDAQSFAFIAEREAILPKDIPIMVVRSKADVDAVQQEWASQPITWCAEHDIPNPPSVSALTGNTSVRILPSLDLLSTTTTTIIITITMTRRVRKHRRVMARAPPRLCPCTNAMKRISTTGKQQLKLNVKLN
eukprot:TRINITY_DN1113_c0_g1_i14.p1 TRINITY_DN1113_c0_g1~~TRINITY_DN1113_c0_g1_i14.p1  ORF type:complete len:656 (-),score=163.12 TRINITY_DN1113_c0_g1_i14:77-1993(-)